MFNSKGYLGENIERWCSDIYLQPAGGSNARRLVEIKADQMIIGDERDITEIGSHDVGSEKLEYNY